MEEKFNESVKMTMFKSLKTDNAIIDALLSTLMLTFMGYIIKIFSETNWNFDFSNFELLSLFHKKNVLIIDHQKKN